MTDAHQRDGAATSHRLRQQLQAMLSMAPVGLAICDELASGRMRLNRTGAAILGVDADSGVPWRANETPVVFFRGEQPLTATDIPFERVVRTKQAIHAELLRVARPDGERRDLELTAWPILNEVGDVSGLVGMFSDVTARRRAQDLRERQQTSARQGAIHALLETDFGKVLQALVDRIPPALDACRAELWRLDLETQQILLDITSGAPNRGPAGSAADRGQVAYALASEEPLNVVDGRLERRFAFPAYLSEAGLVSSLSVVVEVGGRARGVLSVYDARPRHFLLHETNFLQTMADLLAAVLVRQQHEIGLGESQRRKVLAEAEQRTRRAERLASLGSLAAGIAHEINNPLNAILMNAELALITLQPKDKGEKLTRILQTIIKEAKRAGSITRNVLQFSKADRFSPKEHVDIKALLEKVCRHMAPVLQKYGSELDLKLEERLPELAINPIALEQAVANLITNAAQAEARHIGLTARREGGLACITVRDDGCGIPTEDIPHVFDPFYTTRRQQGGSGLGLSLVHRIIADHDGEIEVRCAASKGAEFVIKLPLPPDAVRSSSRRAQRGRQPSIDP